MIICGICRFHVPERVPVYARGGKLVCGRCKDNAGKRPTANPKVDGARHSAEFDEKLHRLRVLFGRPVNWKPRSRG